MKYLKQIVKFNKTKPICKYNIEINRNFLINMKKNLKL